MICRVPGAYAGGEGASGDDQIRYNNIRKWRTAVQVGTTNYIVDIFRLFHVFLSILLFLKIYK